MYELILMAALGSGSAGPAWCGSFGMPVVYSGCYGSGCYGWGCYGSWPVSSGCWGTWTTGGCWGSVPQNFGCYGSGWGTAVNLGCYGSSPVVSGPYRPYPTEGVISPPEAEDVVIQDSGGETASSSAAPVVSTDRTAKAPPARQAYEAKESESIGSPEELSGPARATLVVHLPAEARVTVNDAVTRLTSDTRTFVSPPLPRGQDYHYTLKAELTRNGRTLTTTRRVTVRAGEEKQVTLTFPSGGVAAGR